MKIDIADYVREERFRPRLSTGVHEIFVRIGGTNTELDELSVVEGYNPITNAWRRLSEPLGEPLRGGYSTCALGPDLYICGGRSSDGLGTFQILLHTYLCSIYSFEQMFSISTSVGQLEPNKWHANGPRISCIRIVGWISLLYLI